MVDGFAGGSNLWLESMQKLVFALHEPTRHSLCCVLTQINSHSVYQPESSKLIHMRFGMDLKEPGCIFTYICILYNFI